MDEKLRSLQRSVLQDPSLESLLAVNLCRATGHTSTDGVIDQFYIRICARCKEALETTSLQEFSPQSLQALLASFSPGWKTDPSRILQSELYRRQELCNEHSFQVVMHTSDKKEYGLFHTVSRVCQHCTRCVVSTFFYCQPGPSANCQCNANQWRFNEATGLHRLE